MCGVFIDFFEASKLHLDVRISKLEWPLIQKSSISAFHRYKNRLILINTRLDMPQNVGGGTSARFAGKPKAREHAAHIAPTRVPAGLLYPGRQGHPLGGPQTAAQGVQPLFP